MNDQDNSATDKPESDSESPPGGQLSNPDNPVPHVNPLTADRRVEEVEAKDASVEAKQRPYDRQPPNNILVGRPKNPDRWMTILTAIIAVSTLANVIVYWRESESAAKQTQNLIDAANIQSSAASKNAGAADRFADSASIQATAAKNAAQAMADQVKKLQAGVAQTSRLANATEVANTNALEADRPWVGIFLSVKDFEVGKTPTYTVTFLNTGKRPAKIALTQTLSVAADHGENPLYAPYDSTPSGGVVVPGQTTVASWTDARDREMQPISDARMKLFTSAIAALPFRVYARVEYSDLRTNYKYWTHSCWRYVPAMQNNSGFVNCSEYNDAK